MKKGIYKRVIYLGVLIVMSIWLAGCIRIGKSVKIGEIESFHYSYSVGYAMDANYIYDIKKEDDKIIGVIKPNGVPEEKATTVELTEDDLRELESILKELKIGKWDGFKKSDKNVLDGDSFSVSIWFTDKTSIHASGYMSWPPNYKEFRDKRGIFFEDIINRKDRM